MPKKQGIALETADKGWFTIHGCASSVAGTAIHNGHDMEVRMVPPEDERRASLIARNFMEIRDFIDARPKGVVIKSLEKKLEMREGNQGALSNRELAIL